MDLTVRLNILDRLFAIYDEFVNTFDLACRRHCAHCCTANVTMTTLEGSRILAHLERAGRLDGLDAIHRRCPPDRYVPCVSINRLADICARGADPPEAHLDPDAGSCPLLDDGLCGLYPVRPFGCRCMVSAKNCGETGFADMDPFILTVNDVFLQHIEHIDAQGYTGNFCDVLRFLSVDENRERYATGRLGAVPNGLVSNQPMFVLMIPPEHRERIHPLLVQIRRINV